MDRIQNMWNRITDPPEWEEEYEQRNIFIRIAIKIWNKTFMNDCPQLTNKEAILLLVFGLIFGILLLLLSGCFFLIGTIGSLFFFLIAILLTIIIVFLFIAGIPLLILCGFGLWLWFTALVILIILIIIIIILICCLILIIIGIFILMLGLWFIFWGIYSGILLIWRFLRTICCCCSKTNTNENKETNI